MKKYSKPKYAVLSVRFLSLLPDQELPACADLPNPWRCELFYSQRAVDGLVKYENLASEVKRQVRDAYFAHDCLGHESGMGDAVTFVDYLQIYRLLTNRTQTISGGN